MKTPKPLDLETEREALRAGLQKMIDGAKADKREFDSEETTLLKAGIAAVAEYTKLIAELDGKPAASPGVPASFANAAGNALADPNTLMAGDWTTSDGHRANLRAGEKFTEFPPLKAEFASLDDPRLHGNLGKMVAALTTSGASATVPTTWSTQVIDLAIAQSAIGQAGSTVIPMNAKTIEIGRVTANPTAAFRTEGSTITESDPSFDNVTLVAKTLNAMVTTSVEWLQDSQDGSDLIQNAIAASMASQLDLVGLYGGITTGHGIATALTSPPNPTGILASLQAQLAGNAPAAATNGTTPTSTSFWAEMLRTAYLVRAGNHEPNAMIWNSSADLTYALATDTTGQPLNAPARLPKQFVSNRILNYTQGSTSTASDVFFGDFSRLLVGVRHELSIQRLSERYADTGQVGFIATWRGDFAVSDPKAFAVFSGIKGS